MTRRNIMNETNKIDFINLAIAILGVTCFVLIGVFIAEQSVIGIILSLLAGVGVIGMGFVRRKKRRERGEM